MVERVFIIDLSAMTWRAWHVARKAEVSAPFIFAKMMVRFLKDCRPEYIVAAEDRADSHEVRKKIYPGYKQKERPVDELRSFLLCECAVVQIVDAMQIPRVSFPGYEADDVIASLATQRSDKGQHSVLVAIDKDLFQLLNGRVTMYDSVKRQWITEFTVMEQRGFLPSESACVQALTGDASDNVPGVPGVGPKTAAKLVSKYGSHEAVFDHLEELTPSLRHNLRVNRDQVIMAYSLVKLHRDLPVECELRAFDMNEEWKLSVRVVCERLGFSDVETRRLFLF